MRDPGQDPDVRLLSCAEALNEALREEMDRDEGVIVMGIDIGVYGGAFKVTRGLYDDYGPRRVLDTPISETGFLGAATGAAMAGLRPVVEAMFVEFTLVAFDQVVNNMAKLRYMSGGQVSVPLVLRTQQGGYRGTGAQHSQSLEALFAHIPGLKVVLPSDAASCKGLLKSAIRDDNPVVFIEHKMLYPKKSEVPSGQYLTPIGTAAVKRAGADLTVVALSRMVEFSLEAARQLEEADGVTVEVIDPQTIRPLDIDTITKSVRKTGRLLVVHEAVRFGGFGAEIVASVQEAAFDYLDAPIARLGAKDVPLPAGALELSVLPSIEGIADAMRDAIRQ